jgi:hypothetical protein
VLSQAERIGTTMTELRKHELRTLLAVRAQLTPEQQQELLPPGHDGHCGGRGHDGHGYGGHDRDAKPED